MNAEKENKFESMSDDRSEGRDGRDGMDSYDGEEKGGRKLLGSSHSRRKQCRFCTDSEMILDYKCVRVIQSFLTEHGKIVPRRISGNCAQHQRQLTSEVKRARNLALVGFTTPGFTSH